MKRAVFLFLLILPFSFSGCREPDSSLSAPPDQDPPPDISWEQSTLPFSGTVQSILADENLTVFVGTWGGGLFRSVDGGVTWVSIAAGVTNDVLSICRTSDSALLIGTDAGIYRSTDNGDSWSEVLRVTSLIRDMRSTVSGEVFASAFGLGIYQSIDNGVTWDQLPQAPSDTYLCVGVSVNGYHFVGTNDGLYRTTDVGLRWEQLFPTFAINAPGNIAMDSDGMLLTAIGSKTQRSTDNGETWIEGSGIDSALVSVVAFGPGGTIIAGTAENGMFISADLAASWTEINTGLTAPEIRSLACDPAGYLYAGTWFNGLFKNVSPIMTE